MGFGYFGFSRKFAGICGVLERRGIFGQNSGNFGVWVRRRILIGIPGNCEVFMFLHILNYVFDNVRDFY